MEHKVLSREKTLEGHIFSCEKVRVQLPDGKERNYDLVNHGEAVVIVPVTEDGKILFVRQYRLGAGKIMLELPAGMMNPGEDPDTSAARELREETGNESADIQRLGGFYITPGYCTEYLHIYLAKNLKWNPLPQDDDEFLSTAAIPVEEAFSLAENGEMDDAKSIAGLLMAQKQIREQA